MWLENLNPRRVLIEVVAGTVELGFRCCESAADSLRARRDLLQTMGDIQEVLSFFRSNGNDGVETPRDQIVGLPGGVNRTIRRRHNAVGTFSSGLDKCLDLLACGTVGLRLRKFVTAFNRCASISKMKAPTRGPLVVPLLDPAEQCSQSGPSGGTVTHTTETTKPPFCRELWSF